MCDVYNLYRVVLLTSLGLLSQVARAEAEFQTRGLASARAMAGRLRSGPECERETTLARQRGDDASLRSLGKKAQGAI